jgi:DNA-binding transcriptional regulator YiaG
MSSQRQTKKRAYIEIPRRDVHHNAARHPLEVKALRDELELSQQAFAELLRVSVRTVSRWESGAVQPDPDLKKRVGRLQRMVSRRLRIDRDPEAVRTWLTTPQTVQCVPVDLLSSERAALQILALQ